MKALVIYDSLYGNTKIIAESIAEGLAGDVTLNNVEEVSVPELKGFDLIIFGAPVHGARPSPPMTELLDKINKNSLGGKPVAAFDTRLTNKFILLFGTAAPKIAKTLKNKGGNLVVKSEGFFVTGGEGPLKDGEVERAKAWAIAIEKEIR